MCSNRFLSAKPFENRRNQVNSQLFDSHSLHQVSAFNDPAPRIVRAKGADELGTNVFLQFLD